MHFLVRLFIIDGSQVQQHKKPRSSNYTKTEKYDLCTVVAGFKSIIESKKTDTVTWKDKETAWDTVASQFNAVAPNATFRSADSLKKCYENIKHNAKKQCAEEKSEMIKTGGGRAKTAAIDPVHEKVISIMNLKTVKGLQNPFDSDVIDIAVNSADDDFIVEMLSDVTDEELSSMQSLLEEPNDPEIPSARNSTAVANKESSSTTVHDNWRHYTATDLKRPLNKKLAPQTTEKQTTNNSITATKKSVSIITKPKKTTTESNTPSISSQRRPGIIGLHSTDLAKQYSELATIKLQLAQEQLIILQAEVQYAIKKRERDEIEFNLRKKCLELDIEIKKRQVHRLKDVLDG